MAFDPKSKTLSFQFDNERAALNFKNWLHEQGEQHYWAWMQEAESWEAGNITGLQFNYHSSATIKVDCGRLDKQ